MHERVRARDYDPSGRDPSLTDGRLDPHSRWLRLDSELPWALDLPAGIGVRIHVFDRTLCESRVPATPAFLRDEAIALAQLSGASVLRDAAIEFLDAERAPSHPYERRLANAARARRRVVATVGSRFDLEMLVALFRDFFAGTGADADIDGPLRRTGEAPRDDEAGSCLGSGIADPGAWLPELFAVMNARNGEPPFLHPIAKAALVHGIFQIVAPLVLGNATVARLLMLRQLLRDGYRVFERWPLFSSFLFAPDRVSSAMEQAVRIKNATPLLECGLETLERSRTLARRAAARVTTSNRV